jgi:hypothetical protein
VFLLLATFPYIGAIALYWQASSNLFRGAKGEPPSNWSWLLVAPVILGGLTPLALAGRSDLTGSERALLLTATALAILFALVYMGMLRDGQKFFHLQVPLTVRGRTFDRVPRWYLLIFLGSAVLCYGAVVNLMVASK